jgi:Transposase, Mutator family
MEAWVHGVSTRKVDDLVAALGVGSGISKSEVSRICGELDRDLDAFRSRPLGHIEFPYVFADATHLKGRPDVEHHADVELHHSAGRDPWPPAATSWLTVGSKRRRSGSLQIDPRAPRKTRGNPRTGRHEAALPDPPHPRDVRFCDWAHRYQASGSPLQESGVRVPPRPPNRRSEPLELSSDMAA